MDTPQDRLRADLTRLADRVYPEEGIAMFLVCENLVADEIANEAAQVTLASLNQDLASALRRDAATLQQVKPEAALTDVAKIVEVLADRDFAVGGSEKIL